MLDRCRPDLEFFNQRIDNTVLETLEHVASSDFAHISYTEAVRILEKARDEGRQWEFPVFWGANLQSEHERYLTEDLVKRPVIVTDYPREIKAFYMRSNDDGKTVAAMDLLVPGIGEIIGGSQREERLDVLRANMAQHKLSEKEYWWYVDLRRYGTVPHGGFGMGLERVVAWICKLDHVRETIPYPRMLYRLYP